MKNFLLALMVVLTTGTLAIAQNNTTAIHDSIENVKADIADADSTWIDDDSTGIDDDSDNVSQGSASFNIGMDSDDFPFNNIENTVSGGILVAIVAIVAIFGMPVFILFVIFFFRYKNRRARYRLAEQALAAGQPLPAEFIRENKPVDQRSLGIKNTFTGIGLFIFLWAITDEFGIGAIGLLVAFMGIGQWIIGYNQQQNELDKDKNEEER